jgi:hypothetical protein
MGNPYKKRRFSCHKFIYFCSCFFAYKNAEIMQNFLAGNGCVRYGVCIIDMGGIAMNTEWIK